MNPETKEEMSEQEKAAMAAFADEPAVPAAAPEAVEPAGESIEPEAASEPEPVAEPAPEPAPEPQAAPAATTPQPTTTIFKPIMRPKKNADGTQPTPPMQTQAQG